MTFRPGSPIDFTKAERELIDLIDFSPPGPGGHDRETVRRSCEAASELTLSLLKRSAIPRIRWAYFTDAEYNSGSKSSRREIFERNGTIGEAIYRHPHFLKYLQYFLYGPNLPKETVNDFGTKVAECEPVTSGDLDEFKGFARDSTRSHQLERHVAAQAFYQLALEYGLAESDARYIRDGVMKIR